MTITFILTEFARTFWIARLGQCGISILRSFFNTETLMAFIREHLLNVFIKGQTWKITSEGLIRLIRNISFLMTSEESSFLELWSVLMC